MPPVWTALCARGQEPHLRGADGRAVLEDWGSSPPESELTAELRAQGGLKSDATWMWQ